MNITFQNQNPHQAGRADAAPANPYMERDGGRASRAADGKQSARPMASGGVNVSFSASESNLNRISCLGDERENREKKSFMDLQQEAAVTDAGISQDYMTLMSNTMSAEDYRKASEEGFDFSSMDPEETVTIVDRIKAELVRSGQQIAGYTDDLDMDTLSAAVGSETLARALTESFKAADIPLTDENVEAVSKAWTMAGELEVPTDGTYRYMVDNEMDPELWNFYLAENSGSGENVRHSGASAADVSYLADENIKKQMDQVLEQAGYEINEENRENAKWLLERGLPLTEESIDRLNHLREAVIPVTEEVFARAAAEAVAAGEDPAHASLVNREQQAETIYQKAARVLAYYQSAEAEETLTGIAYSEQAAELSVQGGDLAARKQLEEVRLRMTAEVNVRLLKSGFSIDTEPMEQLIDALREAERAIADRYFPQDAEAVAKYENWNETNQVVKDIPELPARLLGTVRIGGSEGAEGTVLARFHEEGTALKQAYQKAGESYESLMTAPRADLGDSMKKAFGNVDDLVRELGLEPVEENSRAVRILGYNHMEITLENVERIQAADTQIQDLVRKMTPAATLKMIRDGVNPLEQSFDELNAYFDSLPEDYRSQAESYGRYLYGLEQNHQITQEERESYIGVYRLLHQIEKKDGAAVGAVVNTQAELQFSNLLSAVRSGKFRHMDVKASDEYGTLKELVRKGESSSISEQISRGYEETRLKELRGAVDTDQTVTQMLERGELPASAENLIAARKLAANEENPYGALRRVRDGRIRERQNDDAGERSAQADAVEPDEIWEKLTDKEVFRTEYAEAVEKLQSEVEEATLEQADSSLDVRALQMAHRQLNIMGSLSRNEEYFLSMEIGGEDALVHLTVESGSALKGGISIAVNLGENTRVEAHLQMQNDRIEGFLVGKTPEEVTKLQEAADIFYNLINEDASIEAEAVKLPVVSSENINMTRMSEIRSQGQEDAPDNGMLYHVAKLFLQAIR